MSRRRIGQEVFGFAAREGRSAGLHELAGVIDWGAIEAQLGGVYAAAKGEPGWPPLALFKALLLAALYDLSDVKLAEALDDRASFRRFCGFSVSEPTPERTAFVRFRRELLARGLDAKLFAAVTRQLEARGLAVKGGTLVDATVIPTASGRDGEAAWYRTAKRPPVQGYKAHIAADREDGIVRRVVVTPANVPEARALDAVLPPRPGEVFADSAYDQQAVHARIRAARGRPRIIKRVHKRSRPALNAAKAAWNATVSPIRRRVEKIFGTTKRSYGLARARYLGLARVALQARLTFIAYNLRRATAVLRPAGA
jgi:transposase, IS5 family